jgi:hypothetical protein
MNLGDLQRDLMGVKSHPTKLKKKHCSSKTEVKEDWKAAVCVPSHITCTFAFRMLLAHTNVLQIVFMNVGTT